MAESHFDDDKFRFVLQAMQHETGVIVRPSQRPMLEARLVTFCKGENEGDPTALLERCLAGDRRTLSRLVGALTNGETSFFRDVRVFSEIERRYLPLLIDRCRPERRLRIWSAASSTGQEAYSIAMLLAEIPELRSWDVRVIATDVSEPRLAYARAGVYTKAEVNRGLPAIRLLRHFTKDGDGFALSAEVKRLVEFRVLNLRAPWTGLPEFHAVFLRNAMIYWGHEDRADVLDRIERQLPRTKGGFVVLGSAESPLGLGAHVELAPTGVPGIYTSKAFGEQP